MKLKDYIVELNKLIENNPKSLEMNVITSSDDEGNNFVDVFYSPSIDTFGEKPEKQVCLN